MVWKICNLYKSVLVWEHKSISAPQHLCNSDCCVWYHTVCTHQEHIIHTWEDFRLIHLYHIATHPITKNRQTHITTMQQTHSQSWLGTPLQGLGPSCLAVTVCMLCQRKRKGRLKRAVTQPTKDDNFVSWWHTKTHKLTKGWVWITTLCLFVWIPDTGAMLPMQMPTQMPTRVSVCMCVCQVCCGQEKSDSYNAHTSAVCLIGEQTSRLAGIHTDGCTAATNRHTVWHMYAHLCK